MIQIGADRRKLLAQFVKFGMVGTLGFAVDVSILTFCMHVLGFGPYLGRLISFLIAVTTTWICNRVFTFRGQGGGAMHRQWAKFLVVCSGGFVLNYGTYALLIAFVPFVHAHPVIGVAAGSITAMFFNFFSSRRLVFR